MLVICNCFTSVVPFMNGWVFPFLSEMWKKLRTQVVLWSSAQNFEQMIIYSPTTTIGRWWGSREQSQLVMAIHEGDLIVCEWLPQGYDWTILVMFVLWVGQNWHPSYLQSVIVELFVCNLRDPIHGMEWTIFLLWVLLVYFGGMESESWSPFEPKVCVWLKSRCCRTCHCRSNDHEDKGDLESAKYTIFKVWAFLNLWDLLQVVSLFLASCLYSATEY